MIRRPLPEPPIVRWSPRRKAALLLAVTTNQLTIEEACQRYELSTEELDAWFAAFKAYGRRGLRATLRPQPLRPRRPRRALTCCPAFAGQEMITLPT